MILISLQSFLIVNYLLKFKRLPCGGGKPFGDVVTLGQNRTKENWQQAGWGHCKGLADSVGRSTIHQAGHPEIW